MPIPQYSDQDSATLFLNLLPEGAIWSKEPDSDMAQALATLAPTITRLELAASDLIIDGFPATTVELLPQWQNSLSLPDPCLGDAPTIQQEQQQVVARFAKSGGQSVPFFIAYAETLGYSPVTITEFSPFLSSRSHCNSLVDHANELAYTWQVNCPAESIEYFLSSVNMSMDPTGVIIGSAVIECEFNVLKPSHTVAEFVFG